MTSKHNEAADMLLEVLQSAGLPINTNTIEEVRKVVDADLALAVAAWVDLAHPRARAAYNNQQPRLNQTEGQR